MNSQDQPGSAIERPLERLVSLLSEDMESEAAQFSECAKRHEQIGNHSAAAVAERARELLMRFSARAKQANVFLEK